MDEPKKQVELNEDITKEITIGAGKIDIGVAATNVNVATEQMDAEEDEVEMIEEDEDISGADKPGGPEDYDGETSNDPDYRRYGDPQDFELNDQSSSSSSDSDDGSRYGSNRVGPPPDETSSCSNNSVNEFENQNSQEDSSSRSFYSKRTAQHSIPYNFKLMTQELSSGQSKFMENFDPERSNREKRKLTRKISTKKATLYDDTGLMGIAQLDICDCMSEECPGCHFPCPKCFSNKCGHECRQNRRWMYEEINIEGTDLVIRNSAYYSVSSPSEPT